MVRVEEEVVMGGGVVTEAVECGATVEEAGQRTNTNRVKRRGKQAITPKQQQQQEFNNTPSSLLR